MSGPRIRHGLAASVAAAALAATGCAAESDTPLYQGSRDRAGGDCAPETARTLAGTRAMEAAWAAELRAGSYQFTAALRDGTASSRVRGSAIVAPTVEKNAISLTVKAGANVARLILVDSVGYANLGPATGGGYVRLDPSQPGPGREIFGSTVRGFDKDASLEAFTCALQDFRELGDDTVDGVETTHYRVFVDSSEVRPFQDFGLKPGEAPEVASFDVWLDGGGRTRRMAYDVAGSSATTTNTGFGKPVDISAPPRSQITSGTSTTSS